MNAKVPAGYVTHRVAETWLVLDRARATDLVGPRLEDPSVRMVNRNRGAGTRVLIDELLGSRRPPGFGYEPRSHYAVVAAVAQKRADWGVTIETVAAEAGLRFRPLRAEQYDFVVPEEDFERPALEALQSALEPGSAVRVELERLGFRSG